MSVDLFGNPIDEDMPVGKSATKSSASHPLAGSLGGTIDDGAPLAVRLRPTSLDEIVGQEHLLEPGAPLRRLASGQPMSVFLWGPPGVGKTTIAAVVAQSTDSHFMELSAVTTGVKDVRAALDLATRRLERSERTVLFIDEVHRFNKAQQDVLLPAVENRLVTLIAATTENPSFSVISPLLSRSLVLTLRSLSDLNISTLIDRALTDPRGIHTPSGGQYRLDPDVRASLIRLSGGDGRRVLTYLEEAAASAKAADSEEITSAILQAAVDRATVRYDKAGDQHYDVISAFIKSVRGSDVDAALHYLARMIEAGEDPRFIARRLMILASEDIGMAAPGVLSLCVAAAQTVQLIGMPEARLTLAQATIAAATAPKSNSVITAIDSALADVREGKGGVVPAHLRDAHYATASDYGHGVGYQYAHNFEFSVAAQTYLPEDIADVRYYKPGQNGAESAMGERLDQIRRLLGRTEDKR